VAVAVAAAGAGAGAVAVAAVLHRIIPLSIYSAIVIGSSYKHLQTLIGLQSYAIVAT
jgi:hypothetical protein